MSTTRSSDAGCRVELIVRSTLTLLYSKFFMKSIVGRFLEHARIAAFKNGGNESKIFSFIVIFANELFIVDIHMR